MNLFTRGCRSHDAYLAVPERLGARQRLALERHAASCAECEDALRNGRPVDAALRDAFAPMRERRTIIAPGRVRLAVGPRIAPSSPWWLRAPRLFGRLTEVSVMVSVTLFAVGSSVEWSTRHSASTTPTHSVIAEYFRAQPPQDETDYLRWLRLVKPDANAVDPTTLQVGGRYR